MKTTLLIVTVLLCVVTQAQNGFLIVKKGKKTIQFFGTDSRLTFQQSNGQWITGFINKIEKDSFTYTQEIIRYYTIGTDTIHYKGLRFSPKDISTLPSKRQQYYFQNDEVIITLGHENFVWVRNGFIFQAAGAGYAGISIINDLYRGDPPFAKKILRDWASPQLHFFSERCCILNSIPISVPEKNTGSNLLVYKTGWSSPRFS